MNLLIGFFFLYVNPGNVTLCPAIEIESRDPTMIYGPTMTRYLTKWSSWFSLNNSETVKAVKLALYNIRWFCPTLQVLGKTQTVVFPISEFLVNLLYIKIVITPEPVMIMLWNCGIGPVIKPDTKIDDYVISANYIVINIFPIFVRFRAI